MAHFYLAAALSEAGAELVGDEARHAAQVARLRVGERVAEPSPLDLFLTARFGLHTAVAGRPLWVPNTHGPWPLRSAEVLELDDDLVAAAGLGSFARTTPPASVLFSEGVRTTFGFPQRL